MNNTTGNNNLKLTGRLVNDPVFYHEAYDEKFYTFDIEVSRLSENYDTIPVLISERILDNLKAGDCVTINGQLRTYNKYDAERRKLLMFAFVREITVISEEDMLADKNPNELSIVGYLCKSPIYRTTPLGREISDLLVAVNRAYKKSDYIPAITWGRNARFCEKLTVGTCVEIMGRVQSRTYTKKTDENSEGETRVAYEVSVSRVKIAEDAEPQAE
jgi:single-stranded DNA-binding protein